MNFTDVFENKKRGKQAAPALSSAHCAGTVCAGQGHKKRGSSEETPPSGRSVVVCYTL